MRANVNAALLLGLLAICASCNGQGVSQDAGGVRSDQPSIVAIGTAVPEMSTSLWIVFQDTSNRFWFGSDGQGVYRVDGKTITQFTTKHGLPSDRVRDIQEDTSGNIYITTLGGISKFDGRTFATLTPIETTEWKLEAGDLWFKGSSTEDGPYRYDGRSLYHVKFPKSPQEDEFYSKNPRKPWSPYGVYTIYKDRRGALWFGTAGLGACRFDGKTLRWLYEDHLTNPPGGGSFGIRSIIEDQAGKFWICNTTYRFDVSPDGTGEKGDGGDEFVRYAREPGIANLKLSDGDDLYFMSIVEDKGELWMATYGAGVWRYDGKKTTHYPIKDGKAAVTVFSIYKDRQGVLWLGTHEHGAYRFNGTAFEKFGG